MAKDRKSKEKRSKDSGSKKSDKRRSKDSAAKNRKTRSSAAGILGVDVKTEDLLTIIHLVGSHDPSVIYTALENIRDSCGVNAQTLQLVCERGIWVHLKKLFDVKDADTTRLLYSFVGRVLKLTQFPLILLDESRLIFEKAQNVYMKTDDDELLSDASLIMCKLLGLYEEIAVFYYNKQLVNRALLLLKNKLDEDLLKLNVELLTKVLTESKQTLELVSLPNFQADVIICNIKGDLVELQKALLNLLIKIASFKAEATLMKLCSNNVPHALMQLLMDDKYVHIYFDVIYVCSLIMSNYDVCNKFADSKEFLMLLSFMKIGPEEFLLRCVQLLSQFTIYQNGDYRQKLHTYGIELAILHLLDSSDEEIQQEVFKMMLNLSNHGYGLSAMINDNSVAKLIDSVSRKKQSETIKWAVKTILCFLKKHEEMLDLFRRLEGVEPIFKLLMSCKDEETCSEVLTIAQMYLTHSKYKEGLMSVELFQHFLSMYTEGPDEVSAIVAGVLNDHTASSECRALFTSSNGCTIILNKLRGSKNTRLIKNTLILMKTLSLYKAISQQLLMAGGIPLLKTFEHDYFCAKLIINALSQLYLPLKFFMNKHLDYTDYIKSTFYLIKGEWKDPFPLLEELVTARKSNHLIVYSVDYTFTNWAKARVKTQEETLADVRHVNVPHIIMGKINQDPYLYSYFQEITIALDKSAQDLYTKVEVIAQYVAQQLSGFLTDSETKQKHIFRIHVSTLKQRLGSNVIPIGFLRMGDSCERSLLFKVLADYVNVMCTLQTEDNLYWNEVSIVNDMRIVHYVVDLQMQPGNLYPMKNHECLEYFDFLREAHSSFV